MAVLKTQLTTMAKTKAEARRLASVGNDRGWKVVAGKVVGKGKKPSYGILFQQKPKRERLKDGTLFEPVAAYASRKPNPLPQTGHTLVQLTFDDVPRSRARRSAAVRANPVSPKSGFIYRVTYDAWDEEALEAGDTDDKGWKVEQTEPYDTLDELLRNASREASWVSWGDSHPSASSSITSEGEYENRTGLQTYYTLFIERTDGKPLTTEQLKKIDKTLGLKGRFDARTHKSTTKGRAKSKPNPTGSDQFMRQVMTGALTKKVKDGGIYFAQNVEGRPLSVGPYKRAGSRPSFAIFMGNTPVVIGSAGDAVAHFMALAKPGTIHPSPSTKDVFENPVCGCGGVTQENPLPRGWRTPVRPAPGAAAVDWAKVAEIVNSQIGSKTDEIYASPSKRALKWFQRYEYPRSSAHSISRTEARQRLEWVGIKLDALVEEAINASFGEYAMNPTRQVPEKVEQYYQEAMQQPGMIEAQAWAIAWSRYCKYTEPASSHCKLHRSEYFPGKGGKGSEAAHKCKPVVIELERAEGMNAPERVTLRPGAAGTNLYKQADKALKEMAMRMRAQDMNKTDFLVEFEGGRSYEGRIDLSRAWVRSEDIAAHIKTHVTFMAGKGAPGNMSPSRYAAFLASVDKEGQARAYALDLLENCDLGPSRPSLPVKLDRDPRPLPELQGGKKPSSRRPSGTVRSPGKKASKGKSGAAVGDQLAGGLADAGPPIGVDPKQVEMGIKVEMEHTSNTDIAREIAYDHLTEDPDYYTKLATIEDENRGKFEIQLQRFLQFFAKRLDHHRVNSRMVGIEREPGRVRVFTQPIAGGPEVAAFFVDSSTGEIYRAQSSTQPMFGVVGNVLDLTSYIYAVDDKVIEISAWALSLGPTATEQKVSSDVQQLRRGTASKPDDAAWRSITVGQTLQSDKWRIHRYMTSLRITDLTNAGKRGKKVTELVLTNPDENLIRKVLAAAKSGVSLESMKEILPAEPMVTTYRGIDVEPAETEHVGVTGKDFSLSASPTDFTIAENDVNMTRIIPPMTAPKTATKKFYEWAKANRNKIAAMDTGDLRQALRQAGIRYHQYCAMD